MATAIETACAMEPQITTAAKYLVATKAAGFETLISIMSLDFPGMVAGFPALAAVKKLLTLLKVKDNTLSEDSPEDQRIVGLICFYVATAHKAASVAPAPGGGTAAASSSSMLSQAAIVAKEKKEADAYGLRAYKNVENITCDVWPAKHRVTGKDVQRTEADFNSGTITKESYKLNLQRNVLATDEDKKTALTNELSVTIGAAPAEVLIRRNGEFLIQAHIFKGRMLASGMRPVAAHADNPEAGSAGTKCIVEVDDPANGPGAVRNDRWHVTPAIMGRWFMGAVEATCTMTLPELNAVHEAMQERTGTPMQELNFNYGSALSGVMNMHTWHSILASLPLPTPTKPPPETPPRADDPDAAELKELRSERKRLANELEQSRSALKRRKLATDEPPPSGGGGSAPTKVCFDFQRARCTRGSACVFRHACERCGSEQHGSAACPAPRP